MNSLNVSMEIGFEVTISKSEVQITLNVFPLVLNRLIVDLTFLGLWWSNFGCLKKQIVKNLISKTLVIRPGQSKSKR